MSEGGAYWENISLRCSFWVMDLRNNSVACSIVHSFSDMKHRMYKLGCLWVLSFSLSAQITIDFPKDRIVFQQNQMGQGHIFASASSATDLDSLVWVVETHEVPGISQVTYRFTSFRSASGRVFQQWCAVPGGWYQVRAEGYWGGIKIQEALIPRVGIGEVFLIAGQSNAQGQGQGARSSEDPWQRVSTILGYDPVMDSSPAWNFHEILSHFVLFPMGVTAWCWGELGDLLVQRRKVPILFLNAALGETTSAQWANSMEGNGNREGFPGHMPYHYLKTTLQYYQHILGFRAILWHQGETDTFFPSPSYFSNLKKVIEGTRAQSLPHLAWVVSKASYLLGQTRAETIEDQNRIIAELPHTFAGPATDTMIGAGYRSDGIHFSNLYGGNGLTALAQAWNSALTDDFFRLSEPVLPRLPLPSPCGGALGQAWESRGDFSPDIAYLQDSRGNYGLSTILPEGSNSLTQWRSPDHDRLEPGIALFTAPSAAEATQKIGNSRTTLASRGSLLLAPGFEVFAGTVLHTQVTPCGN